MKRLLNSALCLTALATSAFADTRLTEITTHAGQVKKGSEQVALHLKAKQPDAQAIHDGLTTMGGDIENLQRLVVELTEANPQFIQRGDKDWDLLEQKVQLLAIFHNTKGELMKADDMKKNRSLLRAHAKGLAMRAGLLQKTAQRIQR
jgi:hypothetical protein